LLKNTLIILLGLASITASLSDSFTLMAFKIDQEYIAKNLCIEKEVENNSCQGCCQLKKQLAKNKTQDTAIPDQKERKLQIDFFSAQLNINSPDLSSQTIPHLYIYQVITIGFLSQIFHPPKLL